MRTNNLRITRQISISVLEAEGGIQEIFQHYRGVTYYYPSTSIQSFLDSSLRWYDRLYDATFYCRDIPTLQQGVLTHYCPVNLTLNH